MTLASPRLAPSPGASRTWPDDTIVYAGARAVFGSQRWDLTGLRTAVNKPPSAHLLDFTVGLPGPWSLLARELCMCRIDVKTARQAGIVVQRPAHPLTSRSRVSQLRRVAGAAAGEAALREPPGAPPDRIAELLHQVETAPLGRDDQREVGLVHGRVGAAGAVPPLDLVLAQRDPAVPVDDPGRNSANVRYVGVGRHGAGAYPQRMLLS